MTKPPSTGPVASGPLRPNLAEKPAAVDVQIMVISRELPDVLAAVIHRIREPSGAMAVVASYDPHERIWNPPMPLLFQRRFSGGNRAIPAAAVHPARLPADCPPLSCGVAISAWWVGGPGCCVCRGRVVFLCAGSRSHT